MGNSNRRGRFGNEKFTRLLIFLLINLPVSSIGSVYPSFYQICIFESIRWHPSKVIKLKVLHQREVKNSQLAVSSNSHDSQFTFTQKYSKHSQRICQQFFEKLFSHQISQESFSQCFLLIFQFFENLPKIIVHKFCEKHFPSFITFQSFLRILRH